MSQHKRKNGTSRTDKKAQLVLRLTFILWSCFGLCFYYYLQKKRRVQHFFKQGQIISIDHFANKGYENLVFFLFSLITTIWLGAYAQFFLNVRSWAIMPLCCSRLWQTYLHIDLIHWQKGTQSADINTSDSFLSVIFL